MYRRALSLTFAALLAVAGAGCSLFSEVKDETAGWNAEKMYRKGHESLVEGDYNRAIKMFETLEGRYPYGRHAQQAIIEGAYAQYKTGEPALAIAAADRFIKLHPDHPTVDYMYYLKGLANFNEDLGFLGIIAEQDLSERDPKSARESYVTFRELVTKFPESRYARDAHVRMAYLVNALAAHEVHAAWYYFNRAAYLAAANRAQYALVTYPHTPANEEGLVVLLLSYEALKLDTLRDDTRRVLAANFPNNPYLAGKLEKPSWWKFWASNDTRYVTAAAASAKGEDKPWWKFW
ncbi:MAG: outer membrane protein assembly factor BamD [Betaproteobacteria bacterium]|nr:outer membrane protein assembly factor BamD [Betaproteobacteria bacterium]